jgi:molybdenum cofactor cytidylyltransferase
MAEAVDGVLLAGGCSCRAGTFKMTAEVGGKPLLQWGLESMAAACGRVIVVAGSGAERIAGLVAGRAGVELVLNARFADGMLSSVQAGAALVRTPRFFLLPGDMPLVRAGVYRELLGHAADVVVPACSGRRGHPVLLARSLVPGILAEPPGSSLGAFLRRLEIVVVETGDPGVLADLDFGEDFEMIDARLRARSGENHE